MRRIAMVLTTLALLVAAPAAWASSEAGTEGSAQVASQPDPMPPT